MGQTGSLVVWFALVVLPAVPAPGLPSAPPKSLHPGP